jgi:hypothetical protein
MHREFGGNDLRLVCICSFFPMTNVAVQVDALPWGDAF